MIDEGGQNQVHRSPSIRPSTASRCSLRTPYLAFASSRFGTERAETNVRRGMGRTGGTGLTDCAWPRKAPPVIAAKRRFTLITSEPQSSEFRRVTRYPTWKQRRLRRCRRSR